ncbi:DUF5820 family protein [Halosegnis longus]|uniref:Uncharacterized protein n=1 Tax=Halosegnis longus TaxID=2216012 RepID=A0AAJ4UVW4_9EURY|nr:MULTISPECIES: DUF5820 family protein [Halobacteriales]RNJ26300.1 hypothetical protein Nmn1133_06165 [Salella cibi]
MDDLPDGWDRWNDGETKLVWAYRPDVFNGSSFPAACLPTIYITQGKRTRRPGAERDPSPDTPWYVTLYLEPEVARDDETFPSRDSALAGARDLAARFTEGDVDYRRLYQVPRETYFAKLDELTGRDGATDSPEREL